MPGDSGPGKLFSDGLQRAIGARIPHAPPITTGTAIDDHREIAAVVDSLLEGWQGFTPVFIDIDPGAVNPDIVAALEIGRVDDVVALPPH